MVRGLVVVASLALAGCGGFIETGPGHPLGKFEEIDALLAGEKGLAKRKGEINNSECFRNMELWESLEGMTVWEYEDTKAGNNTHVKVVVDAGGEVKLVKGRFGSGRMEWSDSGTRVESFVGKLWAAAAGGPATFAKENRPRTIEVDEFLVCTFDRGGVAGRWEKIPTTKAVTVARNLNDHVLLYRK